MKRRSKSAREAIKGRHLKAPTTKHHDASETASSSAPVHDAEVARLTRELNEALVRQAATSEVLEVIRGSSGDLERVFAAMLQNAVRICDATFGNIYRWDGQALHLIATHNTPPAFAEYRRRSPWRLNPTTVSRTIASKTVVHIADFAAEPAYTEQREPGYVAGVELGGIRTLLVVPMLKKNELIGVFTVYRQEVRPFTDKQIDFVKKFCGASRHRRRKRAAPQRVKAIVGAAEGHR